MKKLISCIALGLVMSSVVATSVSAAECTSWVNQGSTYQQYCDTSSGACEIFDWRHAQMALQDQAQSCVTDGKVTISVRTVSVKTGCC